ncbi:hypothetical protein WM40_25080 [Robbsia andropogonis]|uniref:DNA-binding protein n=1 Tax=Robbsia andropogonis TaxID=28092 RepID=A0A0F5JTI1_9BURK|nr:hypothetical protein WM40_25080 [Robbsia andropogonis]
MDHVADRRRPWRDLEAITGISRQRWRSAYLGVQRLNDEMICALGEHWPQYICWLVTGDVHCAEAQTEPENARTGKNFSN